VKRVLKLWLPHYRSLAMMIITTTVLQIKKANVVAVHQVLLNLSKNQQ
jgi:hypothetical protein